MDLSSLLSGSTAITVITVIVGPILGYRAAKTSKPSEVQEAINSAFSQLTAGFRAQIDAAQAQIMELTAKVEAQTHEIARLQAHIEDLSTELHKRGIQPPPRRKLHTVEV